MSIYESSKREGGVKEATQFKISLVISVLRRFLSDPSTSSVLDISAGWGDRLIGAISSNVANYVAFDPNTNLREGHRGIIDHFARDRKERFKVIYEPFEKGTLPGGIEYDLVFTSPPFFDLEVYTDAEGQSLANYSDGRGWLVNFLFASLKKAWGALKEGGHMVIHITDSGSLQICEPMVLYCSWKLRGCDFQGVLSSRGGAGIERPMWVFRKGSSSPHSRKAEATMKKYHRDLYELC